MTVYNISEINIYNHTHMMTYSDILSQVSHNFIGQFPYIGMVVMITAGWHIFGGDRRHDWMSIEITGALDVMSLVFGMYLIALYVVYYTGVQL